MNPQHTPFTDLRGTRRPKRDEHEPDREILMLAHAPLSRPQRLLSLSF
jgi:hypothetical protein